MIRLTRLWILGELARSMERGYLSVIEERDERIRALEARLEAAAGWPNLQAAYLRLLELRDARIAELEGAV